ncbi:M20 family metallopeptidase [Sporomusa aerivorans]|uniref:M20 family metallopeptidase n=1 Tax=Sporomusa aerivorans TaxID=204936 RepID=UPI00352BB772
MAKNDIDKEAMLAVIDRLQDELSEISDFIFHHPEIGYQEIQAAGRLAGYLKTNGFAVEMGYGGLDTAFRGIYRQGSGGPRIGLLCEYDAVKNLGHACAHHLQGPSIIGAAMAVKNTLRDFPYTLEVIGTPAEECAEGGKNVMLANGAFQELDAALMMHGSDVTTTDNKSLALSEFVVTFHGTAAHSAIAPDKGRSALEAVLLALNGIAYLRGHVRDDVRIHAIIEDGGQVINAIPAKAVARIEARAYDRPYLEQVINRLCRILDGAALMTDTTYEIERIANFHNKIPVLSLNRLLMDNAGLVQAKAISSPREKTGSTDFASVMYYVPGSCIRVAFVEQGMLAHSQGWLDLGTAPAAHAAIGTAAKILALTCYDLITDERLLAEITHEFIQEKARLTQS